MIYKLFFLILFLTCLTHAQTPPDVHVKLSFGENKTVYKIGEPIALVIDFSADREGYLVEFLPDDNEPGSDTVAISPDSGFTRWYDELNDNRVYPRHVFSTVKLTSSPRRVEVILNDRIRFDSPGRYTVRVTTRRISTTSENSPIPLTTNPLSFEVQSMSEADEAKEVKRLSDLLDAKRDYQADLGAKHFSYLTGDVSTREKVRRVLSGEQRTGNYNAHIWRGLYIARNRALVLKLFETALRDPNVPVTGTILNTATTMRKLLTYGVRQRPFGTNEMLEPWEDPRAREIRDAYIVELAAGLGKRTGLNQTTTAATILAASPTETAASSAGLREARRVLVQQFDSLNPYTQEWILHRQWDEWRDPALVPLFKRMLATTGVAAKSIREGALKRLMAVAPDEARQAVIAEIRDPSSPVDPKVLGELEDQSLPEVDASLLEQIRRFTTSTQNRDRVYLGFKVALLVRFATDSIYQELMQLYQASGEKLAVDARGGLLAYLIKHNDREAIPLLERALAESKPGEDPALLRSVTQLYYSKSIGEVLKKLVETDDHAVASYAAYLIGKHGLASDERLLEARLKRWQEQWRDRVFEADMQHQGQIERELIYALINGKSWKPSAERAQELKTSCITKVCKQSNFTP